MMCECGTEIEWKEEWYVAPDISGRLMEHRVYRCEKCGNIYEQLLPVLNG